jgi:hypothetical protein
MNWQLYLKENLNKKEEKIFFNSDPIIYNEIEEFEKNIIESINDFRESVGDNWAVNIQFSAPTNKNRTNFRLEFFEIIDKFDALKAKINWYTPKKIRKHIIDSFVNINDITSITPVNNYNNFWTWFYANKYDYTKNIVYEENWKKHLWYFNKNLAYIEKIWNTQWLKIKTYNFIELRKWSKISANTRIYAKKATRLRYLIYKEWRESPELGSIIIPEYSWVTFQDDIEIDFVSKPVYIKSKNQVELTWVWLQEIEGLPLLPWTKIEFNEKEWIYSPKDFIEIRYYNNYLLKLHFSKIKFYEIVDLWNIKDSYLIRLNIKNDFYYAKIAAFDNKQVWTSSKQLLISPQEYNDNYAPEIDLKWNILVPVYSLQETDITDYVYEDSWINNIASVTIDEVSWQDWKIKVIFEQWRLKLKLWKYDEIIKKKIKLILKDKNWNTWEWLVNILIYPPVPNIKKVSDDLSTISWAINEELKEEPISIFRYRAWILTKLKTNSWDDKVFTNEKWEFIFNVNWVVDKNKDNYWKVWIYQEVIDNNWNKVKQKIAELDKNTWKINKLDNNSYIRVLASNNKDNDKWYLKIILSKDWRDLYYSYVITPNTWKVKLIEDLNKIYGLWVFVKMLDTSNYWIYQITVDKDINPWSLVIYDIENKKREFFRIFRDWRVEVFNWATIKYSQVGDYLTFDLVIWPKNIAKLIIKTENNFILR